MNENGPRGLRVKVGEHLTKLARSGAPIWFVKTYGNPYGRPGVPDYLICYRGRFAAIELKSEGKDTTPTQAKELAWIARAGGATAVVRTMAELEAFLANSPGLSS